MYAQPVIKSTISSNSDFFSLFARRCLMDFERMDVAGRVIAITHLLLVVQALVIILKHRLAFHLA